MGIQDWKNTSDTESSPFLPQATPLNSKLNEPHLKLEEIFAFNPCFQKLAHSLLALQGFGRLGKIPCNSPVMGDRQGTQHFSSPDSSPSVLTDAENS